jgi:hypothetical protein
MCWRSDWKYKPWQPKMLGSTNILPSPLHPLISIKWHFQNNYRIRVAHHHRSRRKARSSHLCQSIIERQKNSVVTDLNQKHNIGDQIIRIDTQIIPLIETHLLCQSKCSECNNMHDVTIKSSSAHDIFQWETHNWSNHKLKN